MARWWRFFLFLAPVASVDMPCALTPQTVARIHEWVHSGVDPGGDAFDAVHCAVVRAAGGVVGGLGGGAAGYSLASAFADRVGARFCGDSERCRSRASTFARVAGGVVGYAVGGAVGNEAASRTFGRGGFFGSTSPLAAVRECAGRFGLAEDALTADAVDEAYRKRSLVDHPDKKGGSNEDMAKTNVCRELLRAAVDEQRSFWEL